MDAEQTLLSAAYLQDQQEWESKKAELSNTAAYLHKQIYFIEVVEKGIKNSWWIVRVFYKITGRTSRLKKKVKEINSNIIKLQEQYENVLKSPPNNLSYEVAIMYSNKLFSTERRQI